MKSRKIAQGYLLRLERGEDIVKVLHDFCDKQKVQGAWLSGLGGVTSAQVGYYHLKRKKYVFRHIKDVKELTNLTGNVARVGEQVALHLHGTFTDQRNKAHGGHIKRAEVGGTIEILVTDLGEKLERAQDETVGLPLLKL